MTTNSGKYLKGLEKLRGLLAKAPKAIEGFQGMADARAEVLAQFQPIFNADSLDKLDEEQFKSFLLFEKNRHWSGLHRQGGRICADMKKLREVLAIMLDEQESITSRWDKVIGSVLGMGKAIMSAILLIAHPDQYGVWNNTSETALRTLGLWPDFSHGTSPGEKYEAVNRLLNQIAKDLNIDLWTLDSLFWVLKSKEVDGGEQGTPGLGTGTLDAQQSFGLEKHLHDFLFENWDKTELGKEWMLYAENNDPDTAYEYPTDVGEIDLLAKHCKQPRWLVVELKRGQTSDDTVGQILRYTGWIKRHLAKPGEKVEGLIIARTMDQNLRYAASEVPHISLMEYQVSFHVSAVKSLDEVPKKTKK